MLSLIFLISTVILMLASGCESNANQYEAVEIDFLNVRTLEAGDWIEIDGVRFTHVKEFEKVEEVPFSLPASRITRGLQRRNPDYSEPFPSLNIGYILAGYINDINKEDELMVNHDHTYTILNPDLIQALGKIQFIRTDTSGISIETSPDYPVQIRTIPVE